MTILGKLAIWLARRNDGACYNVGRPHVLFKRYEPFWADEYKGYNRSPWYRPFNILLHRWLKSEAGGFHDHPRWTITIVLRGSIIEHTPWKSRLLGPGMVVFRSHRCIHRFDLPEGAAGKTWTLFIVGRRNYKQHWYDLTDV